VIFLITAALAALPVAALFLALLFVSRNAHEAMRVLFSIIFNRAT
jgi:hypothetical protein